MTDEAALERAEYLYLITTGRRTGEKRRVELWYVYQDGACYLLAGVRAHGQGSHWYHNGLAAPQVELEIEGSRFPGTFQPLEATEVDQVLSLFHRKYGEGTVRRWYTGTQRFPVRVQL